MRANFSALAVAAAAVLLASCGGGGSDSTVATPSGSTSGNTGSTNPVIATGTTYTAGSPQASAFVQLNSARTQCGFSALSQAAELDQSASAHANYMALNNSYAHDETQGQPGFTGVQFSDRETAAGYRWTFAGEVLAQVAKSGTGSDAIRLLLAAPYHEALLLNDFHDVGFGWSTVNGFPTLTADLGTRSGQSATTPVGVVTYPCAGVTDAIAQADAESPSPFPSNSSATWGQPIVVRGPADLAITSATITGPSGSVQIEAIYGNGQTADPNSTGDFSNGWFVIIPATLQSGVSYNVSIGYTSGGVAGTRAFAFSTR